MMVMRIVALIVYVSELRNVLVRGHAHHHHHHHDDEQHERHHHHHHHHHHVRRLTPGILGSTPDEVNGKFTPNGKFHAVGMDFDSQQAFVEAGYPCRYQEPTDEELGECEHKLEEHKHHMDELIAAGAVLPRPWDKSSHPGGLRSLQQTQSIDINVYFNVITKADGTGNIDDATIYRQIDVLNAGFAGQELYDRCGGDLGQPPPTMGTINTHIKFVLKETNIRRIPNDDWFNLDDGQGYTAMKNTLHRGSCRDINIYTGQTSYLGWAYFPPGMCSDGSVLDKRDGLVLNYQSLPKINPQGAYEEGDTAVHEVGHWLGLPHTFGSDSTCVGGDSDSVIFGDVTISDTPAEATAAFSCPIDRDSCPALAGVDPIHNFMDYTNDCCMFTFTEKQRDYMVAMAETYRGLSFTGGPETNAPSPAPQTDAPTPAPQAPPPGPPPPPPPPPPGPLTSAPVSTPTCTNVTISIVTDAWPQETTWDLFDSSGAEVKAGGNYLPETTYETNLCLPDDTYTFTIYDSYGDGIFGEGYSIIVSGDTIATSEGNPFNSRAVETFTIEGGGGGAPQPPPTAAPVTAPPSPAPVSTDLPSESPLSSAPTYSPTLEETQVPSTAPTTSAPSSKPSQHVSNSPSLVQSSSPSVSASNPPSVTGSNPPSVTSTFSPSAVHSDGPSSSPTAPPVTSDPTALPTVTSSSSPSVTTSSEPSATVSSEPSATVSSEPSATVSSTPSFTPSVDASNTPSSSPTTSPMTSNPTLLPTVSFSSIPTVTASAIPSSVPTSAPVTPQPSSKPSGALSTTPSSAPTQCSSNDDCGDNIFCAGRMECISAVCQCVKTPPPTSKAPSPNPTATSTNPPSEVISAPPSKVLTSSPTSSPACGCADFVPPGDEDFWYDFDGPFYSCEWYENGSRCSAYGSGFSNFGYTAKMACCACGGGVESCEETSPVPSPAPQSDAPSPAPQTDAPSTAPQTDAPSPGPQTNAPSTAPQTDAPTPAPQTDAPTPAPQAPPPGPPPPPPPPPPGPLTSAPVSTPTCTNVTISIVTDAWPQETTWDLFDSSGAEVKAGGNYLLETTYETNLCLPDDTYTFTIYDSYGDGIFGEGYSIIVSGDTIATSEGNPFNSRAVETFTIEGGGGGAPQPPPTAAPVTAPPSPAPTTACQCFDYDPGNGEEWYDSDGPSYNCAWYSQNSNCATYGNSYENFGKTAGTACCACGGGSC